MSNSNIERKSWLASKAAEAFSFEVYVRDIERQIAMRQSSGSNQSPEYAEYTQMGYTRMTRWLKTLNPSDFKLGFALQTPITMLTLTESWCGDAAHITPILHFIANENNLSLKLLYRDEHPNLMNDYLTHGSKSIPKVIFIDAEYNELGSWGPRPAQAQELYQRLKATGDIQKIIHGLQMWYNKDKGLSTKNEIQALLKSLLKHSSV